MRHYFFGHPIFLFAADGTAGGGGATTPAVGGASGQTPLFPEDDDEDPDAGGLAGQIATMPPEEMSKLAQGLEPDVRLNFAQALIAAMPDDDKLKIDSVPAGDVESGMGGARPERPEEQYQMSVTRKCRQMNKAGTYGVTAENELKVWRERVDSLHEDGYLTDDQKVALAKDFATENEMRFSILLDKRGTLHDACLMVETLETARVNSATLSKSVLQTRFSGAKPPPRPKDTAKGGEEFDRKSAEEAGDRLARY